VQNRPTQILVGRETLTRLCPQTCAKQSCCFTNEIPQALVQTGPIHLHLAPKTLLCCWALETVLRALQTLQLVDHLTWQLRSPLRRRTLTENNKDYSDWENSDEGLNTPNGGTLKYIYIYTWCDIQAVQPKNCISDKSDKYHTGRLKYLCPGQGAKLRSMWDSASLPCAAPKLSSGKAFGSIRLLSFQGCDVSHSIHIFFRASWVFCQHSFRQNKEASLCLVLCKHWCLRSSHHCLATAIRGHFEQLLTSNSSTTSTTSISCNLARSNLWVYLHLGKTWTRWSLQKLFQIVAWSGSATG